MFKLHSTVVWKSSLLLMMIWSNGLHAQQVHNCKGAKGAVVYQDFPCTALESRQSRTLPGATIPTRSAQPADAEVRRSSRSSYVEELEREFNAALASGDLAKADRLASTQQQVNAVNAARRGGGQQQPASRSPSRSTSGCYESTIVKPQPFLGTAKEIIVLTDGSVWQDHSYMYLYLYAYSPTVIMCPAQGKMTLVNGNTSHVFTVERIK